MSTVYSSLTLPAAHIYDNQAPLPASHRTLGFNFIIAPSAKAMSPNLLCS